MNVNKLSVVMGFLSLLASGCMHTCDMCHEDFLAGPFPPREWRGGTRRGWEKKNVMPWVLCFSCDDNMVRHKNCWHHGFYIEEKCPACEAIERVRIAEEKERKRKEEEWQRKRNEEREAKMRKQQQEQLLAQQRKAKREEEERKFLDAMNKKLAPQGLKWNHCDLCDLCIVYLKPQINNVYQCRETVNVIQNAGNGICLVGTGDYSEGSVNLLVKTKREYVDGEALKGYFAYKGVQSYTTVMGAVKTVRYFEEVDIQ